MQRKMLARPRGWTTQRETASVDQRGQWESSWLRHHRYYICQTRLTWVVSASVRSRDLCTEQPISRISSSDAICRCLDRLTWYTWIVCAPLVCTEDIAAIATARRRSSFLLVNMCAHVLASFSFCSTASCAAICRYSFSQKLGSEWSSCNLFRTACASVWRSFEITIFSSALFQIQHWDHLGHTPTRWEWNEKAPNDKTNGRNTLESNRKPPGWH